jgi:uncharacterized protein YndB with AHSA1/START domain/DNA-binding transcriptional ArsR family regulator
VRLLTRDDISTYHRGVDSDTDLAPVFKALAEPQRRVLLDSLAEDDGQTLIRLEARLPHLSRFGVMRHLRVLEAAGLVVTQRVGREKHHYLNPVPIRLIHDRWISRYADRTVGTMAALKRHLEEVPMTAPKHVYAIVIQTTPEALWQAITDGDQTVRYYYRTRVRSDWTPGAPLAYLYEDGSVAADGSVVAVDPPRRLQMTFHARWDDAIAAEPPVTMTWDIEPMGTACRLTVTTEGYAAGSAIEREFSGGIVLIVSGLKTLLETGQALPVG